MTGGMMMMDDGKKSEIYYRVIHKINEIMINTHDIKSVPAL